jgi:transketolase
MWQQKDLNLVLLFDYKRYKMENIKLAEIASQVRRDILRMVHAVSSGHPGGSLGCADFLTFLYFEKLRFDSKNFNMDGKNEDLFFLSNGHISPVWYSVLARTGYFPVAELATFRKISSRLQGHPSTDKKLPGIRICRNWCRNH